VTRETQTQAVEYEEGTDVVVVSPDFTPTVRRGVVVEDAGPEVDVEFTTSPFTNELDDSRTVTCLRDQLISEDASEAELAARLSMYDE